MAQKGWIALHREITENWIWKDSEPFDKRSAWIDLLLMVNHEDRKILFDGQLITVKRGQKITSLQKLSKRWKWSINKVKRFLRLLEQDNMILLKIETAKGTALTIVNYSLYQDIRNSKRNSDGTVAENSRNSGGTVAEINNNDNNDNNDITMINKEKLLQKFNKVLKNKIDMSVLLKNINKFGLEKINLLSDKAYESEWLTNKLDLNILGEDVLEKAIDDFYKDKEERSDYDWYEPIEL